MEELFSEYLLYLEDDTRIQYGRAVGTTIGSASHACSDLAVTPRSMVNGGSLSSQTRNVEALIDVVLVVSSEYDNAIDETLKGKGEWGCEYQGTVLEISRGSRSTRAQ